MHGDCTPMCSRHLTWLKRDLTLPEGTCIENNVLAGTSSVHSPLWSGASGDSGPVPEPQGTTDISGLWKLPSQPFTSYPSFTRS